MYILIEEVEKILEIMKKFPDATNFELVEEGQNGIGSITSLIVTTDVNGLSGTFKVEISGVDSW